MTQWVQLKSGLPALSTFIHSCFILCFVHQHPPALFTKSSWHFSNPWNVAAAQIIHTRAGAFDDRVSAAQAGEGLMIISIIGTALGQQGQQLILLQPERGYFNSSNWPQPAAGIDVLPLLSVCCSPCSDAAVLPDEHKLPAGVNESDCFAPIIDQLWCSDKASAIVPSPADWRWVGCRYHGIQGAREQLIVIVLLIIIMIPMLNDQHLYDADHAVPLQHSAGFTKGFTNYVSEPKSIIMARPLGVMGKRKSRIILNKCCNKMFCLSKYSEYPVGPAAHHRSQIYHHNDWKSTKSPKKGWYRSQEFLCEGHSHPKNYIVTISRGSFSLPTFSGV